MTLDELRKRGGELLQLPKLDLEAGLRWEVCAPDGFTFDGDLHSMVCTTKADVRDRLREVTLERCEANCSCGLGSSKNPQVGDPLPGPYELTPFEREMDRKMRRKGYVLVLPTKWGYLPSWRQRPWSPHPRPPPVAQTMIPGTDLPTWRVMQKQVSAIVNPLPWSLADAQNFVTWAAGQARLTGALVQIPKVVFEKRSGYLGYTHYSKRLFVLHPEKGADWDTTIHELAHWVLRNYGGHSKRFVLSYMKIYGLFCRWIAIQGGSVKENRGRRY